MIKSVLIIDDERTQAENIEKYFKKKRPDFHTKIAYEEEVINDVISNHFYNIAIIDLRMDDFKIDGISIINRIAIENPFAKIIVVSAFTQEYYEQLKGVFSLGKIHGLVPKEEFNLFMEKIFENCDDIINDFDSKMLLNNRALSNLYGTSKLEEDSYKKGKLFEDFVILLLGSMGFNYIYNRVIDKSLNEVDIMVRNDIDDIFIKRFGEYFFIECKNKPGGSVNKNDFILFKEKIVNSSSLAKFGIIFTTGYITWNTYYEAIRNSKEKNIKIFFFSNPEIESLLGSKDILGTFKLLIDRQVKDN